MVAIEGSDEQLVMHLQVADVNKPLPSLALATGQGFECRLGNAGCLLLDTQNGNRVPIICKGNMYLMQLWVRDPSHIILN